MNAQRRKEMTPREHIADMRRELEAPTPEAQLWDNMRGSQRKYLLHSAGHPRHRINEAARTRYAQLDGTARNAVGRGYRNLRDFAREMTGSDTMEVVEIL